MNTTARRPPVWTGRRAQCSCACRPIRSSTTIRSSRTQTGRGCCSYRSIFSRRSASSSACGGASGGRWRGSTRPSCASAAGRRPTLPTAAARLDASEREREKLDGERQKLIADISHDLKTPITVIAGYTSAIRDGKIPPDELPRYLSAIDDKAAALTELINTFYEFSKTEHPDFRLSCEELDLGEYLREYLAEKYSEIDLAGFSLDVRIPETPVHCRIDRFQFRRALDNILSNSLRYNTLGTLIRIRLSTRGTCAVLRISDNGIGIPPSVRDRLFEPFSTGDAARFGGGSGLGLAIARSIVQSHGGSIRLLPGTGEGTAFEILLPCDGSLTKS